jgi:hypothetical protein
MLWRGKIFSIKYNESLRYGAAYAKFGYSPLKTYAACFQTLLEEFSKQNRAAAPGL